MPSISAQIEIPEEWASTQPDQSDLSRKSGWFLVSSSSTLQSFITEALEGNPEIKEAKARYMLALAQADIISADRLPTLQADVVSTRTRTETQFDLSARLSWEIDLWGRLRAQKGASIADARAAEADLRAARLSVETRTAQSWAALINANLQRTVAQDTVSAFELTTEIVDKGFFLGLRSLLDVQLAGRDLANSRATLEARIMAEHETARAFEVLLGRYPSGSVQVDDEFPSLEPYVNRTPPTALLTTRPDIQAAYARLEAAVKRLDASEAAQLPVFNLVGSLTASDGKLGNLLDPNKLIASIVGSVVQPLFDGGRRSAQVTANLATMDELSAVYIRTVLSAYQETQNLLSRDYRLLKQQEFLETAFARASQAEVLSDRQYRAGLISLSDLLQTKRSKFDALSQLFDLKQQRLTTLANLHLAVGGAAAPSSNISLSECPSC